MAQPKNYGFEEEAGMLKDGARRFFAEKLPVDQLHALVADALSNPLNLRIIRNSARTILRTESPEFDQRSDGYIKRTPSSGTDPRRAFEHLEQTR